MDTPMEIARDKYYQDHFGECVTCKYYRMRKTFRNGKYHEIEWCDNEDNENYKQLLEDIYECGDYREKDVI